MLQQTFRRFELIIVNDASTDGSLEEVKKFNDPRIRVLHRDEPGPGGYAARNLGIREARAEWISFLDADDLWYPHHLASAYSLIRKYPECDFGCFGYKQQKNDKIILIKNEVQTLISRYKALKSYADEKLIMHTNAMVIKKKKLIEVGAFPAGKFKRGGDVDLWLRLILASDNIALSPEITSKYIKDYSGITSDIKTTFTRHPVTYTVESNLSDNSYYFDKYYLKKIANKFSLLWCFQRKRESIFQASELQNIYFSAITFRELIYVFILLIPDKFYRLLYPKYKKLVLR